jgi:signal transduction histidine kinase
MRQSAEEIQLEFADKGPGIKPEDMPFIFEPFFRSEETRKLPGHGIGLSLVNRILQLHQGTVEVSSQERMGAKFTVKLPLAPQRNGFVTDLEG